MSRGWSSGPLNEELQYSLVLTHLQQARLVDDGWCRLHQPWTDMNRLYKYVLNIPVYTWIDCSCAPHASLQSSTKNRTLLNLPTFLFGQNEQNRRCGHDVHETLIHDLHPSSYGTSLGQVLLILDHLRSSLISSLCNLRRVTTNTVYCHDPFRFESLECPMQCVKEVFPLWALFSQAFSTRSLHYTPSVPAGFALSSFVNLLSWCGNGSSPLSLAQSWIPSPNRCDSAMYFSEASQTLGYCMPSLGDFIFYQNLEWSLLLETLIAFDPRLHPCHLMSCCACPPSWPPAQGGSANKSPSKARRQKGQNDRRTIRLAKNDKKEQGYMSLGDKATAFFRFTCLSLFEIQHVDGFHLDVYQRVDLQLADLPGSSLW